MAKKYYVDGYYYGQTVICTSDEGPNRYHGIPLKGAIGTIENWDSWDRTFAIRWQDDAFGDRRSYCTWTKYDCVNPYMPEPARTEEGHRICGFSGAIVEDDAEEMVFIPPHGWVSKDSVARFFKKCAVCDEYHETSECIKLEVMTDSGIKEAWVCNDCLETEGHFYCCADCGRWFDYRATPSMSTARGLVCDVCAEEYVECPECHEYVLPDDLILVPQRERPVCAKCRIRLRRENIKNYSYKPRPKFKVGSSHDQFDTDKDIKELLFGVELEVDKGNDDLECAGEIIQACEDVYCKHDGSLSCGIEIVSHPATLEYHLNELGWDRIAEICRKFKFTSHEAKTCGLHVHIGRRQLGANDAERENTAGKMVLCMVRHWENMVKFSRRLSSQLNWAECNKPDLTYASNEDELIGAALETEEDGRYQAVNLCNEATVEIRLFRGTLEVNTIKATLEMVSNFTLYCKEHTALEVMNSQWADIAYYKNYPELYDYLQERKIGDEQLSILNTLPSWEYPGPPSVPENCETNGHGITGVQTDECFMTDYPCVPDGVLDRDSAFRDTRSFREGEYVLVVNHGDDYDENAPVGRVGRAVVINHDEIGVRFGTISNSFHRLGMYLPDRTGYFVRVEHLVHYDGPHSDIPMPGEEDSLQWAEVEAEPELAF